MIHLTEKWSVYRDPQQWVLVESYMSKPTKKHPESRLRTKETYHPWLDMAMRHAAESDCEGASTLKEVEQRYLALVDACAAAINKPDRTAFEAQARYQDLKNANADLRRQLREARKAA